MCVYGRITPSGSNICAHASYEVFWNLTVFYGLRSICFLLSAASLFAYEKQYKARAISPRDLGSCAMLMGVLLCHHRFSRTPSRQMAIALAFDLLYRAGLSSSSVGRFDWVADISIVAFLFPLCVLGVPRRRSSKKLEGLLNMPGSARMAVLRHLQKVPMSFISEKITWIRGMDRADRYIHSVRPREPNHERSPQ